jgi:multidrug efflux pump
VFLCLAALYESWSVPFAVLLVVPLGVTGALVLTWLRHLGDANISNDVYFKIGLLTIIGLAAKNAILIVEFAVAEQRAGRKLGTAVVDAARLRLRPILMTSFAFILGVLPLVISTGSGSEMRQAVGVAVFFGMLGVTLFGLIFTPIFYMVVRNLAQGKNEGKPTQTTAAAAE